MKQPTHCDLFVIGGGSGGVRAAREAAKRGVRVVLAEKSRLGGTCVNVGCVPKKLFYFAASFAEERQIAAAFGYRQAALGTFDWDGFRHRRDDEITRLNGIYQKLLNNAGVEIITAAARLTGEHTVVAGDKTFHAEKILLANGGVPALLDIPGKELALPSDQLFSLPEMPARVILIGGGYIALEFAGIFAGLGAETTLCYRADLPLRGLDEPLRRYLAKSIPLHGVKIHAGSAPAALAECAAGKQLTLANGDTLTADAVFSVTGRRPAVDGLGLESAAIEMRPNGTISVDDSYQTSCPSIYAVGDLLATPALTPVAIAEAEVFVKRAFDGDKTAAVDYDNVPTAVFCRPQLATAGLSESAARRRGIEVVVYETVFRPMKSGFAGRADETLMRLIVARADDRVIGAQMIGEQAGEIMQGIAVAIAAKATKKDFDDTIGIHPTSAEEFVTLRTPVVADE